METDVIVKIVVIGSVIVAAGLYFFLVPVRSQRAHKEFAHTEQDRSEGLCCSRVATDFEKDRAPCAIVFGSVSRGEFRDGANLDSSL